MSGTQEHVFSSKGDMISNSTFLVAKGNVKSSNGDKYQALLQQVEALKKYKKEQQRRPTVKESHLRLIVEWIEQQFGDDPVKGLQFFTEFKEKFPEFTKSFE